VKSEVLFFSKEDKKPVPLKQIEVRNFHVIAGFQNWGWMF
jgi:hypothetical protein